METLRLPNRIIKSGHEPVSQCRIHKGIALRYVHWARDLYGLRRLADLDGDAERLVALYLLARRDADDSPSTLKTIRAALRMFHRPAYAHHLQVQGLLLSSLAMRREVTETGNWPLPTEGLRLYTTVLPAGHTISCVVLPRLLSPSVISSVKAIL